MKNNYSRAALVLSIVFLLMWSVMGTGTSLAWFTDTSEEVKNIFEFADFDLDVEYRTENGEWKTIENETQIFDEKALYEPGYVQVVYLRVINKGDVPFDFRTAVNTIDYTPATNIFGQTFNLQDYLKFGLTEAVDSEEKMDALVQTREMAKSYATIDLCSYETKVASLDAGTTVYMALVVQMPEEVDNNANYRGNVIPRVELGLVVNATQQQD